MCVPKFKFLILANLPVATSTNNNIIWLFSVTARRIFNNVMHLSNRTTFFNHKPHTVYHVNYVLLFLGNKVNHTSLV